MPDTLVTLSTPRSPVAEAYRTLRTNLEFSSPDRPLHSIVVTSAGPEEGKSTTLANLAVAMAQAGETVILADCDLRRPSQHQLFNLRNSAGITDLIRDESMLASPPLQDTQVPTLKVLTSGPLPPNPAELLGSRRMGEVIAALLTHADRLLFDVPPILAVTDAALLSAKVDGVLIVISAGKTKRESALKAKVLLEKVNSHLIGTVLNNVRFDSSLQYYYSQAN